MVFLDYGNIICDQPHNASFHQKLESLQYNACLAVTGTIHGSSREKYTKNYNQFHNILRLFDVLPNFLLATSETMCDYYL